MRTGIYFPPLLVLALLGLAGSLALSGRPWKPAAVVPLAFLCLSVVLFAAGFTTSYYAEWRYDRSTKAIIQLIRARHQGTPRQEVRVALSWPLEPSVNFYRRRYRLDWMKPPGRVGSEGDFDYYLLMQRDLGLIGKQNLRPVFSDPVAEVVAAVPGSGPE